MASAAPVTGDTVAAIVRSTHCRMQCAHRAMGVTSASHADEAAAVGASVTWS